MRNMIKILLYMWKLIKTFFFYSMLFHTQMIVSDVILCTFNIYFCLYMKYLCVHRSQSHKLRVLNNIIHIKYKYLVCEMLESISLKSMRAYQPSLPALDVYLYTYIQGKKCFKRNQLKPDNLGWRTEVMRRDTTWGREKEA